MQAIYENLCNFDSELAKNAASQDEAEIDKEFFTNIIDCAVANWEALLEHVQIDELSRCAKAVIMAAVAEMKFNSAAAENNLIIHEYIEVSKNFCSIKETKYINKILDGIAKQKNVSE